LIKNFYIINSEICFLTYHKKSDSNVTEIAGPETYNVGQLGLIIGSIFIKSGGIVLSITLCIPFPVVPMSGNYFAGLIDLFLLSSGSVVRKNFIRLIDVYHFR